MKLNRHMALKIFTSACDRIGDHFYDGADATLDDVAVCALLASWAGGSVLPTLELSLY
jgi:hypothetical protein